MDAHRGGLNHLCIGAGLVLILRSLGAIAGRSLYRTPLPRQGPKLFRVYCRYSPLCQNFAAETIGGCLRTASCKVGRLFDRNAEVAHRSLDECIGGDNQLKLA